MELKDILEAILFSSQKPLSAKELQDILKQAGEVGEGESKEFAKTKAAAITKALETLAEEVDELNRSHRLVCVAGSWQFVTQTEYAPWVRALVGVQNRPTRLSQPALQTPATNAYPHCARGDRSDAPSRRTQSLKGSATAVVLGSQRRQKNTGLRHTTCYASGFVHIVFRVHRQFIHNIPDAT